MVTLYQLDYNQNPKALARRISEKRTVTVSNRHSRPHEEEVNEDTVIKLFSGETMKLADFLEKYLDK